MSSPPSPHPTALQSGPGHPLFLGFVALLLVNDHWLKAIHPGPWLTGKLSDVAWLVVAPVVLGAVLARGGVAPPHARRLALGLPALAFVLLQLWPPLGNTWVSLWGGAHVADPTDLLALPALLLVPLCWRPGRWTLRRPGRRLALVAGAGALMATSYPPDLRVPCDETPDWDPQRPLVLQWAVGSVPDNPALLETGISLRSAGGETVPLEVVRASSSVVLVCPVGGLAPETDYVWKVGQWTDLGDHVHGVPSFGAEGTRHFTTAATSSWTQGCVSAAARSIDDCSTDSGGL